MNLLAIDPSSTRTGYAVMDDGSVGGTVGGPPALIDCGYLTGRRKKDGYMTRIRAMGEDLDALLREHAPGVIVIEVSSGKVGRRHGGGGAGLAVYGTAVGWLARACFDWIARSGGVLCPIEENEWTRGEAKRVRAGRIAAIYPAWAAALAADTGHDVADAIGLGVWWFNQKPIEGAIKEATI